MVTLKASYAAYTKDFSYTGGEQTWTAPYSGYYKLEVWGAQGGTNNTIYFGGYGGYSVGSTNINKDTVLYINVGGSGVACSISNTNCNGGYNGGGNGAGGPSMRQYSSSGGGATHIGYKTGLLTSYSFDYASKLLIVAGGGGGAGNGDRGAPNQPSIGGHGGGYIGGTGIDGYQVIKTLGLNQSHSGTGGTQKGPGEIDPYASHGSYYTPANCKGSFGKGGNYCGSYSGIEGHGGGGGFYGGGGTSRGHGAGGGGSGYVQNLYNAYMYTYKQQDIEVKDGTIIDDERKTDSIGMTTYYTSEKTSLATSDAAKLNNGAARITYLGTTI